MLTIEQLEQLSFLARCTVAITRAAGFFGAGGCRLEIRRPIPGSYEFVIVLFFEKLPLETAQEIGRLLCGPTDNLHYVTTQEFYRK